MSKDARLVQNPALSGVFIVDPADVGVRLFPEGATLYALLQGQAAPLHKPAKHIVQGDLGTAPLDDVTANLREGGRERGEMEDESLNTLTTYPWKAVQFHSI